MISPDAFAARLDAAARQIERAAEPITRKYGDEVAELIDELAPKRTRGVAPPPTQVRTGVIQPSDYLVGQLVGSASNPPRSDRFLKDSLDEVEPEYKRDVERLAVGLLAGTGIGVRVR